MWVSTQAGQNRFTVDLDESMSPNIYVHVTLLQPHTGKKSDTPIRLYGVIPVMVENPKTRLEPRLKMADELKPLQDFRVSIQERSGRPMTYTLAVVDEGLLGLTRYSAPDLRKRFYSREALGVRTWDLFDDVAEAYGAELSRLLALGGDEREERPRAPKRSNGASRPSCSSPAPFPWRRIRRRNIDSRCRNTSGRCGSWSSPGAPGPSAWRRNPCRCART